MRDVMNLPPSTMLLMMDLVASGLEGEYARSLEELRVTKDVCDTFRLKFIPRLEESAELLGELAGHLLRSPANRMIDPNGIIDASIGRTLEQIEDVYETLRDRCAPENAYSILKNDEEFQELAEKATEAHAKIFNALTRFRIVLGEHDADLAPRGRAVFDDTREADEYLRSALST